MLNTSGVLNYRGYATASCSGSVSWMSPLSCGKIGLMWSMV
jgi:hypothetical protein